MVYWGGDSVLARRRIGVVTAGGMVSWGGESVLVGRHIGMVTVC